MEEQSPRERARAVQAQLFPPGGRPAENLPAPPAIARDWNRLSRDAVMGMVWSRPGLELRERSMIVLAMLTVLNMPNELRLHLRGALNLGLTQEQICEVIMQAAIYGGWPVAVEGMRIASEVFAEPV